MGAQYFLFYIILSNCLSNLSVKIKTRTFDRLSFMFVKRCVVVKNVSVKERHFSDNLIQTSDRDNCYTQRGH